MGCLNSFSSALLRDPHVYNWSEKRPVPDDVRLVLGFNVRPRTLVQIRLGNLAR